VRRSRRTRRLVLLLAVTALVAVPLFAVDAARRTPLPEINFAVNLLPRPCVPDTDDPHELAAYKLEGWPAPNYQRYPGDCQRLRFAFGPILVKPGQNDVLVQPVTIEKPAYDGYITRIKPDLVDINGKVPPIEQVHLHHGTWLSFPDYGIGPFFAAGEEKTILPFPRGFGLPVKATDQWLLLYMVHSAIPQPKVVYITYDIDYVAAKPAKQTWNLKSAYPVWHDVRPSAYPVFNTQRIFGGRDGECSWPKEQCASFDPYGKLMVGQGRPGNGKGQDLWLPDLGEKFGRDGHGFTGGTLIGMGGHLHPGGIRNEIDLVRGGANGTPEETRRIYTGEACYWDRVDPSTCTGDRSLWTSWDFSMRVVGNPFWGVRVKPLDRLRGNAVYDTLNQSTYENMGIVVSLLAPDDENGNPTAPGVDPFDPAVAVDDSPDCASGGLPAGKLCLRGKVTHGHLHENDNFGGPAGAWTAKRGKGLNTVAMGAFVYLPGDLSMVSMTGVPTVKLGNSITFANVDTPLDIYHTATACTFPCLGNTGTAFPLAKGVTSIGRDLEFDSGQLGIGIPAITGAKNEVTWKLPVTAEAGFKAGEVVTYFCRVHPFMRGAFEVV
jgi:hypothetical protein